MTVLTALSGWWTFGWVLAAVVVAIAAVLLLVAIALTRRITGQIEAVTAALDGARANTDGLWEVKRTNVAIQRITRGLAAAREAVSR